MEGTHQGNATPTSTFLALDHNHLTDLRADMWLGAESSVGLEIKDNRLTEIKKGKFDGLNLLIGLHLGSNQITAINQNAFRHLAKLELLYLESNKSTEIRGDMLQGLNPKHNTVSELKEGDLDSLPKIWGVFFEGNNITTVSNGLLDSELYPEGHPEKFLLSLPDNS